MSKGLQRGAAGLACRLLQAMLPESLRRWGEAVRCEVANIPDDTQALRFAIGSLFGLMPRALLSLLHQTFAAVFGPRTVGIACVMGAVALGLAYLGMADAPARYFGINVGALILGLTALSLVQRSSIDGRQGAGRAIAAGACVLVATSLLGGQAAGAARWVSLGGLSIQPSLVLLPLMLVAFVRVRSTLATLGVVAAATALALQPDRGTAGMLAAGLAVLSMVRLDRHVATALVASVLGLGVTLLREDTLPAVPYVDQILYSAFDVHPAAGVAVLVGSALLLVPAIVGWRRDPANRATYAVFGAVWFTGILAAALGNYPTPIVGYGGSAIIGYALSLLALPKVAAAPAGKRSGSMHESTSAPDRQLLVGLA